MKVLVTGRHGQLARSLLARAASAPGLSLVASGRPELDLERPETLGEAVRKAAPDVVVNAAAYTAVDKAEDEPERAQRLNAEAPGMLAAAAREAGARFIQLSTDYVFDGTGEGPYREDAPTSPLGVYGRTKLEGEARVAEAMPDHVILRTAWVYSPFGTNFVRTMIRLAAEHDTVRVVADQRGNPTSAADLADGVLQVLRRWAEGGAEGLGQIYHLAGSGETSWAGFAEAIFEECARSGLPSARVEPIPTSAWPTRAPRPANSTLDCTRFATEFGYLMPHWKTSLVPVVQALAETARAA